MLLRVATGYIRPTGSFSLDHRYSQNFQPKILSIGEISAGTDESHLYT